MSPSELRVTGHERRWKYLKNALFHLNLPDLWILSLQAGLELRRQLENIK